MLVTGNIVATLDDLIAKKRDEFCQGVLENPPQGIRELPGYQLGLIAGNVQGFKRALDVIHELIAEEEAREAAR